MLRSFVVTGEETSSIDGRLELSVGMPDTRGEAEPYEAEVSDDTFNFLQKAFPDLDRDSILPLVHKGIPQPFRAPRSVEWITPVPVQRKGRRIITKNSPYMVKVKKGAGEEPGVVTTILIHKDCAPELVIEAAANAGILPSQRSAE